MNDEVNAQTYVARGVSPSQPLAFTVGGAGQLPRETTQAAGAGGDAGQVQSGQPQTGQQQNGASAATDTRPGGGLGNPIDPEGANDPWAKYKWWILGGIGLLLAAGAGVMLRGGTPAVAGAAVATSAPTSAPGGSLAALKEELFSLETDRLQGRISAAEYDEHKAALETVLRRVLARNGGGSEAGTASRFTA